MMVRLNTIDKMTEELAKSLIGKHIHFTWHNKDDNTKETMPGKVLSYDDNKITIGTMDITMLDDENKDGIVMTYDIDDITDIFPFEDYEYNHDFLHLLDDVNEEDLGKTKYDINLFDATITTTILDYDMPLTLTFGSSKDKSEYPLYFIKSITRVK